MTKHELEQLTRIKDFWLRDALILSGSGHFEDAEDHIVLARERLDKLISNAQVEELDNEGS